MEHYILLSFASKLFDLFSRLPRWRIGTSKVSMSRAPTSMGCSMKKSSWNNLKDLPYTAKSTESFDFVVLSTDLSKQGSRGGAPSMLQCRRLVSNDSILTPAFSSIHRTK